SAVSRRTPTRSAGGGRPAAARTWDRCPAVCRTRRSGSGLVLRTPLFLCSVGPGGDRRRVVAGPPQRPRRAHMPRPPIMSPRPPPPWARGPRRVSASSWPLVWASPNAPTMRSWRVSTSSGSTTWGSTLTPVTSPVPRMVTVTRPAPACPSTSVGDSADRKGCRVGRHQRNRTIRHRARTRGVPAGSGRRRRPGAARGTVDVRRAARARPRSAVDRAGAQVLLEQRERDVLPVAVVEILRSAACLVDHLVLAHRRPGWIFRFGGFRLGLLGRGRGVVVSPVAGAAGAPLRVPGRRLPAGPALALAGV